MTLFIFSAIGPILLSYYVLRKLNLPLSSFKIGINFFNLGIFAGIFASVINSIFPVLSTVPKQSFDIFVFSVFNVGLVEETIKFLCLLLGIHFFDRYKSFSMEKIILFSVLVAAGFGFIENLSYAHVHGGQVLIGRTIFSLPLHMCFGFIMGWNYTKDIKYKYLYVIGVPVILHGLYDFFAFIEYRILAIIVWWCVFRYCLTEINTLKENGK